MGKKPLPKRAVSLLSLLAFLLGAPLSSCERPYQPTYVPLSYRYGKDVHPLLRIVYNEIAPALGDGLYEEVGPEQPEQKDYNLPYGKTDDGMADRETGCGDLFYPVFWREAPDKVYLDGGFAFPIRFLDPGGWLPSQNFSGEAIAVCAVVARTCYNDQFHDNQFMLEKLFIVSDGSTCVGVCAIIGYFLLLEGSYEEAVAPERDPFGGRPQEGYRARYSTINLAGGVGFGANMWGFEIDLALSGLAPGEERSGEFVLSYTGVDEEGRHEARAYAPFVVDEARLGEGAFEYVRSGIEIPVPETLGCSDYPSYWPYADRVSSEKEP